METLYEKLKKYCNTDVCPMHMPGHKRNTNMLGENFCYDYDITEIDDFDNLFFPNGIIAESENLARKVFKSKQSFYLINGTSCGNLAAIRTVTNLHDKIIIARGCHKSVYNACAVCGLKVEYIESEIESETFICGSVSLKKLKNKIENNKDAKAVVITSPTYDGVISDIESIAKICHENNMILIVDEAHGSHLGMNEYFPKSAVECGADIVLQSLHKTLPALTQCSIAHVCSDRVNINRFKEQLSIFQSTSPSYILIASIDRCVHLLNDKKDELFENYIKNLKYFDKKVKNLSNLTIICHGIDKISNHKLYFKFDPGKIVIVTTKTNITGKQLLSKLRKEYNIELEMAQENYAIAMSSICDDRNNFERLANALIDIDKKLTKKDATIFNNLELPVKKYEVYEINHDFDKLVDIHKSTGQICSEKVWIYPPGVPLIVEGEVITKSFVEKLLQYNDTGLTPKFTSNHDLSYILVNVVDINDKE